MTSRERRLGAVIGGIVALGLAYKAVSFFFIDDYRRTKEKIANYEAEVRRLDGLIRSEESLARQWLDDVGRTFSLDRNEAQGRFGMALKEIAKRNRFDDAVFSPAAGTRIGVKTDIVTVAHRISIDGAYKDAIAFLRDLYNTPYLCQVTKLAVAPSAAKGARGRVKVELTVESPVLPLVDPRKIPYVRNPEPLPAETKTPLPPVRPYLRGAEFYAILSDRNIFRSHLPPPENVVLIDNQDRKMVAVKVQFFWEDKPSEQRMETVKGKTSTPVKGKGDVAEITGTYADGVAFGPKRMSLAGQKEWTYPIASHSPPTMIDLAVNNQNPEAVFLEVIVTAEDGQQQNEPLMVFETGTANVRNYEGAKSVRVTAKYRSGKAAQARNFDPLDAKQTYIVGPEPAEQVAGQEEPVEPEVPDADPDGGLTVSGLVYYPDPGGENAIILELIATGTGGRRIIRAGESGAVDGGTLLTVVPALGGIVKMPTGNYYIYPLGRPFTGRFKLAARTDNDLPAAIDQWTRPKVEIESN
jgi:hypothetical protein